MSTGATAETTKDPNQYRLPTDLKPTHYDLTIHTDLEKLKFNGFITAQYVLLLYENIHQVFNPYTAWK